MHSPICVCVHVSVHACMCVCNIGCVNLFFISFLGYYCVSGATSSTPGQGDMADICPPGSFCPSGTVTPTSCPPGTYNPSTGRQTLDECTNCTGGYYCPNYNMTAPGPQCEAG